MKTRIFSRIIYCFYYILRIFFFFSFSSNKDAYCFQSSENTVPFLIKLLWSVIESNNWCNEFCVVKLDYGIFLINHYPLHKWKKCYIDCMHWNLLQSALGRKEPFNSLNLIRMRRSNVPIERQLWWLADAKKTLLRLWKIILLAPVYHCNSMVTLQYRFELFFISNLNFHLFKTGFL